MNRSAVEIEIRASQARRDILARELEDLKARQRIVEESIGREVKMQAKLRKMNELLVELNYE